MKVDSSAQHFQEPSKSSYKYSSLDKTEKYLEIIPKVLWKYTPISRGTSIQRDSQPALINSGPTTPTRHLIIQS